MFVRCFATQFVLSREYGVLVERASKEAVRGVKRRSEEVEFVMTAFLEQLICPG